MSLEEIDEYLIRKYLPALYQINAKYLNDADSYEQLREVMPEEFETLRSLLIDLMNEH